MGRRSSRRPTATATIKDKDNQKKFEFLTVDSLVEVSSGAGDEEKGFNRAWYVAKILKPSSTKQKDKFLVQYQTKTSEKDSNFKLLTEIVGVSFIRPLPPPPAADQSYELHDVVEAFHGGGWRKGVVSKVEVFTEEKRKKSSKTRRYTVVFENPPEKIDRYSGKLRFHSVWDEGKWVRSPKQKRMKGLKIDKGMAVEVNINGEISQDAWFPAIVRGEVGFNSFLVEYSRSGTDDETRRVEVTIDSFHIRPPPPKVKVQQFEIMEHVDVFHDSCWKKGLILATLTQGRYSVAIDSGKEEILFRHLEIRPHQIWKNGKWIGLKEMPGKHCEEQSASVANSTKHSEVAVSVKSLRAQGHSQKKSSCRKMRDAVDDACEKSPVKKSRKNPLDTQEESSVFGKQNNVSDGTASEMETKDCVSKVGELSTESGMENGGVMGGKSSISSVTDHTAIVGISCNASSDNQALSTCLGSDQEALVENFNQSPIVLAQADSELAMSQEMPFVKQASIWEQVDSLEVFQFLPQQPHFSPLFEINEATREGFAVAHMFNFASLVEKTSKLHVKMSREVFYDYLEALADLETFGFDVEPVVERINNLLLVKSQEEQLENTSVDIHSKIAECDSEKAKMEDEVNAIDKMMSELQERRAVILSGKAKKDCESNMLQIDAHSNSADISKVNLDFERLASAPW